MAQTVELGTDGAPRVSTGGSPDPHGSLLGKSLLHYKVVEVIGQGGMSVVYRGRDENLHRDVAIKVLHPFLAEKAECRARLAREARAVARLEHPHVLKVFDFSGDPDTVDELPGGVHKVRGFAEGFIIAELVRGPTLKRFVEEHELWKVPEVGAMVVWQIASALEHAHKNGVVHRDIKPENVMVREDGWLKLMDFGIAQIADQKGLTITGTLLGSPAHMAPECIDGHAADERSDLFSLGTVLYWITTGALPFEALTPHALLKQIVEGRSLPAQQRSPRISDDLARVIAKSMATKPTERYENAGAFVAALADVLERSGLPADSGRLRVLLADPAAALPGATAQIRAAFLRRAEQHIADGNPARALSCLNRVLAEDQDDADARALVEKVGIPDDAAETTGDDDVVPSLLTTPGILPASLTSTSPTAAPASTTSPSLAEPPRLGRLIQQAAVVVGAVALIAIAVVLATRFDDNRGGDRAPLADGSAHDAKAGGDAVNGTSNGVVDNIDVGKPDNSGAGGNDADDDRAARRRDPKGVGKLAATDVRNPLPPNKEPGKDAASGKETKDASGKDANEAAAAETPVLVDVKIRAKPWADISVDGKPVVRGALSASVSLSPGEHVVSFRNPAAKDVDKKVVVPAELPKDGKLPEVVAELEPRPALLTVRCSEPDAFVAVGKGGGKAAAETVKAPLVVPLGAAFSKEAEVTVYKKGFSPVNVPLTLLPGKLVSIDVKLEPSPASAPTKTP